MTNQKEERNPNSLFKGLGIQVNIKKPDNFLKICETLTRIGVASKKDKKLYQSCHILHKRDPQGNSHYAILHFKELFILDGKHANIEESDIPRRNAIVRLLEEWNLLDIIVPEQVQEIAPIQTIKVLSFKEKKDWVLCEKYSVGKSKRGNNNGNKSK